MLHASCRPVDEEGMERRVRVRMHARVPAASAPTPPHPTHHLSAVPGHEAVVAAAQQPAAACRLILDRLRHRHVLKPKAVSAGNRMLDLQAFKESAGHSLSLRICAGCCMLHRATQGCARRGAVRRPHTRCALEGLP